MSAITLDANQFRGLVPRAATSSAAGACVAHNLDLSGQTLRGFRTPHKVSDQVGDSLFVDRCCVRVGDCTTDWAQPFPDCPMIYRVHQGVLQAAEVSKACDEQWCDLGFEAPMKAPGLIPPMLTDGHDVSETYAVYVVVDKWGNRSAPSLPSVAVRAPDGELLTVDGLPTAYPARWCAAKVEIYLARSGQVNGQDETGAVGLFYAGEVEIGTGSTTVYYDAPGRELETAAYEPPPKGITDLSAWQDGQLAGLVGGTLRFSERMHPHNWPAAYAMRFFSQPLRFVTGRHTGYVLTRGQPAIVKLDHSCDAPFCHAAEHVQQDLPIVSTESAVMFGDSVVYASREGLIRLDPSGQVTNLTRSLHDRRTWESLIPQTIKGGRWGTRYVGVGARGAFVLDPDDGSLVTVDLDAKAFHMGADGFLYFMAADGVYRWDAGDDFMQWRWSTPPLRLGAYVNLFAYLVRVVYPGVLVRIFELENCESCDGGDLIVEDLVSDCEVLTLPASCVARAYRIELSGKGEVSEVRLGRDLLELYA